MIPHHTNRRAIRSGPRLAWAALACSVAIATALVVPSPCSAGLLIEAQNVATPPGHSGSFDIVIVNTGSTVYDVAGDVVEVSLTGLPGVSFTNATIATTTPYIYVLSGTVVPPPSPLSFDTFPNTTFTASDAEFDALGYREIDPGQTFGLVHVTYTVSSSAPSAVGTISIVAAGSSLSDDIGNPIAFTTQSGSFAVVPEPSTAVMLLIGAAGMGLVGYRRRSRLKGSDTL